jgi:hypothetical protein
VLVWRGTFPSTGIQMLIRILVAAALSWSGFAAAQQPAARPAPPPAKPTLQQLLSSGYDLKTVQLSTGACGNQPANRTQTCRRELYFLQSPRKDAVFRCELGTWNGLPLQDCLRVG